MKYKQNRNRRYTPYTLRKEHSEHNVKISKPGLFSNFQACLIFQAIELNGRKKLNKKCIAQLAVFVSRSWEENPSSETVHQLYYMINNLLDTTCMDLNKPFEMALQDYCSNSISTPTICPTITLLVAISYIERLNKLYKNLKGTAGCSFRMIIVAFIIASKYIHNSLKLIIYTNARDKPTTALSETLFYSSQAESIECLLNQMKTFHNTLTSPKKDESTNTTLFEAERNTSIARMELEFLHFLNYDLSVKDPVMLVRWAQGYEENTKKPFDSDYNSADEADDEMDDTDNP